MQSIDLLKKKKALTVTLNLLIFKLSNFKALLYSRFKSDIWSTFQESSKEAELYKSVVPFKV